MVTHRLFLKYINVHRIQQIFFLLYAFFLPFIYIVKEFNWRISLE